MISWVPKRFLASVIVVPSSFCGSFVDGWENWLGVVSLVSFFSIREIEYSESTSSKMFVNCVVCGLVIPDSLLMLKHLRRLRPLHSAQRIVDFRFLGGSSGSDSNHRYKYPHYEVRQTRWNDTDGFGHINNTVYYNFMDDAVNMQLIDKGIGRDYPRFVAENGVQFRRPIKFPNPVYVGLRVTKLGSSSVTYKVGFFEGDPSNECVAIGKFVHVYVCEKSGRPKSIPDEARRALELLVDE